MDAPEGRQSGPRTPQCGVSRFRGGTAAENRGAGRSGAGGGGSVPSVVFRAGLDSPGRPVGNLLFLGPTGAGKTRVVEATAKVLGAALCVSSPGAFTLRWDSSIHRADYPRATLNWSARKSHGRNRSELATPQGFDHNLSGACGRRRAEDRAALGRNSASVER
jgi:hypothetical protein